MHGATIEIVKNSVRDVHMWNEKYLPDGSHVKAETGRRHIVKLQNVVYYSPIYCTEYEKH